MSKNSKEPTVGIIMGSKSDWKGVMEHCSEMLKEFGINHDARVGDFSVINSSCVLNGNVKIGSKVFLGSLTSIRENVQITGQTTIGMSSIVLNNINSPGVYYGQPIK